MPTWTDIVGLLAPIAPNDRAARVEAEFQSYLDLLSRHTQRNVIFYASAFLQKQLIAPILNSITNEDINGFMSAVHGMDCDKGLLLLLHTPGGFPDAAESIVDYLWSKFRSIDILIPTYAMSAGTMISLAGDRLIMGRQSQLGPTDPQFFFDGRMFAAHSIVAQFDEAKNDILRNPQLANAWAPVLARIGPALLHEARKAISHGQEIVSNRLQKRMFKDEANPLEKADSVSKYFIGNHHNSHGRRINREEAIKQGLKVIELEADSTLQDLSLTLYHLATILFESSPAVKGVFTSTGKHWVRNMSFNNPP